MPRLAAETTEPGSLGLTAGRPNGAAAATSPPHTALIPPPAWALTVVGGDSNCVKSRSDGFECTVHTSRDAAMASVTLADSSTLSPAEFDAAVGRMISLAFSLLAQTTAPHAVRVWNFLPDIHARVAPGLDRYRAFNVARYRALGSILGECAIRDGAVPTASCLGHRGRGMGIHMLGAAAAGRPIENPRQVPAFAYSSRFGPRPPCFSRATIAAFGGEPLLMVAGTASVLGEDSVHPGSPPAQLAETLTNLQTVLASARQCPSAEPLAGLRASRIYVRSGAVRRQIADHLPAAFASGPVEWVLADICREELLVEIEVVAGLLAD